MSTFMAIDGVGNWHKIHIGGKQSRMGLRTDDWIQVEWIEKGRYRMMTGMFEDEPIELTSADPCAP